jgi:glycogen debranching enzyme
MVSAQDGDVPQANKEGWGLYYKDTRYLSVLELRVNGHSPVLLTSSGEFNFMGNIQSANPLMQAEAKDATTGETKIVDLLPRHLSIRRNRFIENGMHERLGFFNYYSEPIKIYVTMRMGGDFRDMFDVRGYQRPKRGEIRQPQWDGQYLHFSYLGLDNTERTMRAAFDCVPTDVKLYQPEDLPTLLERRGLLPDNSRAVVREVVSPALADVFFEFWLEPGVPFAITYHIVPQGLTTPKDMQAESFDKGAKRMRSNYEGWFQECTRIKTDNEVFDKFLQRSIYDLRILMEMLPTGPFPVAGIPWYAVPFGRDSLITALQTLMFDPQIAVGTLRFLGQYQGKTSNDWNEEEPGKILHELRGGEMSILREMPHVPYYGSVDSTPLYIMLFCETMKWLNSRALYEELLPKIKAALSWIDEYGDRDGDGFIEYHCHNERGVRNQGWKDNITSLQFRNRQMPEPPIALCEAQGYVYAAKMGLADVVEAQGEEQWAANLRAEAAILKKKFNEKFWMPDDKFVAQALDRDKTQVPTITSNPGHCIWTGILDKDKIEPVVRRLLAEDMSSGWGIRTVSTDEPTYNPMSYHNGSVWPHDNSIIAAGLKAAGYEDEANVIVSQIFAASQRFRYFRLPELFCGFQQDNRYYSSPAEYPVSCSPQAWTAGAALQFVQTMLGLKVDANTQKVTLRPRLPAWLSEFVIEDLEVGDTKMSFRVSRNPANPTSYCFEPLGDTNDLRIEF